MGKVFAGTSGWAYATWKPDFYPAKLKAADFLRFYATQLNSVELNYTFRRFPTDKLQMGWIAATPPDFKFAVKAHQTITHTKRLRGAGELASQFIAALRPLEEEGRLGPVLLEAPTISEMRFQALLAEFWVIASRAACAPLSSFATSHGSTRMFSRCCARPTPPCARRKAKPWKRRRRRRPISHTFACSKRALIRHKGSQGAGGIGQRGSHS